jgi:hypothetical protein
MKKLLVIAVLVLTGCGAQPNPEAEATALANKCFSGVTSPVDSMEWHKKSDDWKNSYYMHFDAINCEEI